MSIFSRSPLTWTLCLLIVLISVYKGITTHDSDTALEVTNTIHIRKASPSTTTSIISNTTTDTMKISSSASMLSPPMYLHGFTKDWRWGSATKVMSRGGHGATSSKPHWYSSDYKEPLQDVGGIVNPPPLTAASSSSPTHTSTEAPHHTSAWDDIVTVGSRLWGLISFPNKYVFTSLCAVRPGELLLSVALILGSGSVLEVLFGNHNDVFIPLKYIPGWSSTTATTFDNSLLDATRRMMVVPFLGSAQYRKVLGTVLVGGAVVFILGVVVMEGVLYVVPSSVYEAILVVLERVSIGPNSTGEGWNWVLTPSPVFIALTIHITRRLITLPVSVTSVEKSRVLAGDGSDRRPHHHHTHHHHAHTTGSSIMGGSHHVLRGSNGGGDSDGMGPSKSISGSTANSGAHTPELGPISTSSSGATTTTARRTTAFITDAPWKVKLAHWLRTVLPPPPVAPGHPSPSTISTRTSSSRKGSGGGTSSSVCESICGGSSTMMAALLNPAERKVIGACGSVRIAMLCGVVPLCVDGAGGGTSAQHPLRTFERKVPHHQSSQDPQDVASETDHHENDLQTPPPPTQLPFIDDNADSDGDDNSGSAREDPAFVASGGSPKFSIFAQSNSLVMDILAIQLLLVYVQSTIIMTESDSNVFMVATARLLLVIAGPVLVAYLTVGAISNLQLFGIITRSGKYFKIARQSRSNRNITNSNSVVDMHHQGGSTATTGSTITPAQPSSYSDISSSDDDDYLYHDNQQHDRDSLLTTGSTKGGSTKWGLFKRFTRRKMSRVRKVPYSPRAAKTYLRSYVSGFKQKLISKVRLGVFNALFYAVATPTSEDTAHRHITEMTMRPGVRKWVSEEWRGHIITAGTFLQGSSTTDARPPPQPPLPKKSDLVSAVYTTTVTNRATNGSSSSQQLNCQFLTPTALAYVDLVHRWDVGAGLVGALGTITFKKHTTQ